MTTEIARFKKSQGHRHKKVHKPKRTSSKLLVKLTAMVPYSVGFRAIRQVSGSWLLQRTLFRRDLHELKLFLALMGQPNDVDRAMRRQLMRKTRKSLYSSRAFMAGLGGRSLREWVTIKGLEELERAGATGRGVILVNSHFGLGRSVPLVLGKMGIEVLSLESVNRFDKLGVKRPDSVQVIPLSDSFLARVVLQAEKALKRGKVVHLAADGPKGESGFILTFLGRQRHFAAGFAELAVKTGAVVVPVFAPFDEVGRVNIEILEALDGGSESMAHSERVESLVRQYARLLEQRWSQDPGNVHQRTREKFLRLPVDQAFGNAASAVLNEGLRILTGLFCILYIQGMDINFDISSW